MCVYLLNINWPLALISISIGPLMILVGKLFGEAMRKKSIILQETMGSATSFLQDVLSASVLYKIFGLEKKISKQYQQYSTTISEIERSQGKVQGSANAISGSRCYARIHSTYELSCSAVFNTTRALVKYAASISGCRADLSDH
ncbi:hypothetical protein GRF59_09965 [Paenibacillus sp. HJL G12]|uniref:ABC transmembrane type-1 domain-containing protein n=1 Tax=Paenibacillus dendrobii TaxID=2691084 RepID=A0A7X3IHD9_9BACL|nr:hypothetical protein [Paenibacillus dendrobii]